MWRAPFLVLIAVAVACCCPSSGRAMARTEAPRSRAAIIDRPGCGGGDLRSPITGRYAWSVARHAVGALAAAAVARGVASARRSTRPIGVLYIAPPCLALIWLRGHAAGPRLDDDAVRHHLGGRHLRLRGGNALKGPKLWPRFSPNKTWAGFFGGLVGAPWRRRRWSVGRRLSCACPSPAAAADRAGGRSGHHGGRSLGIDVEARSVSRIPAISFPATAACSIGSTD